MLDFLFDFSDLSDLIKSQLADENSLLKYYAKVIDIRNKYNCWTEYWNLDPGIVNK